MLHSIQSFHYFYYVFAAPLLRPYAWIVGLRRDQLPFRECDIVGGRKRTKSAKNDTTTFRLVYCGID